MKTKTMKIKNRILKTSFLMLISSLMVFLFTIQTYAINAAEYSIDVGQTVKVDGEGSKPTDKIKYEMKALTPGAPLPDGATGGVYKFELSADATQVLSMKFNDDGEYKYLIKLDKNELKNFTLDDKQYELTVSVETPVGGEDPVAKTLIIKDAKGYKYTDVEFKHQYTVPKPEPKPEPQPEKPIEKIKKAIPKLGVVGSTGYLLWIITSAFFVLILFTRKKKQEDEE